MMVRCIAGTALAFIATAAAAEQPEQTSAEQGSWVSAIGPTLLVLLVGLAVVAICLAIAWGVVRVLVHSLVRIGVLPKPADRTGRWRVLNSIDYAPAGVVTTTLFPLGTSAAATTGRLRPLEVDPRTGEHRDPQEDSKSGPS
ncbi:MAG TPA: hypothetical protein VFB45_14695 [Pseudolabrys sp.]|nr:hypothetical protein [Pseudolabrys sp.]